ncbi:MAG TPA: hypothetical protein VEB18_01280 [Candidatus Paceibacterota bacterium]|nr:hypothetical protein [Candidatus Paceibacterota bacterium]
MTRIFVAIFLFLCCIALPDQVSARQYAGYTADGTVRVTVREVEPRGRIQVQDDAPFFTLLFLFMCLGLLIALILSFDDEGESGEEATAQPASPPPPPAPAPPPIPPADPLPPLPVVVEDTEARRRLRVSRDALRRADERAEEIQQEAYRALRDLDESPPVPSRRRT